MEPDYDVLIIGSGFGGSVSALRLTEKGYRVGVLEAGPRYSDADFAKTSWDLRKFLWAPKFGMYGIQRISATSRKRTRKDASNVRRPGRPRWVILPAL